MKKNLITLAAASLMLAACGNNNLTPKTYSVHVIEDERATITIDQLEDYQKGDLVSFTVTLSNEEYELDSVLVAGYEDPTQVVETTKGAMSYYFLMPEFDVSISVVTSVKEYTIELSQNPSISLGLVDLTTNKAAKGTTVRVSATILNPEIILEDVYVASKLDPSISIAVTKDSNDNYSFVMPNYDVYVGTSTSSIEYAITFNADEYSSISCPINKAVAEETVSFTVTCLNSAKRINDVRVTTSSGQSVSLEHSDNTYSFVMPSEGVAVTVETEDIKFSISLVYSESFSLSIEGGITSCVTGTNVTAVVYSLSTSLKVKELVVKCGETPIATTKIDENRYSFVMPSGDVEISVIPASSTNSVSIQSDEHATVSIMGSKEEFAPGEEVMFAVSAKYGYVVDSIVVKTIKGEEISYTGTSAYSFIMPDEGVIIIVRTSSLYTVTVSCDSYTSASVISSKDYYNVGESVSFTIAVTDPLFELDKVEVKSGSEEIATSFVSGTYSFYMPAGNVTIYVTARPGEKPEKSDPFTSKIAFQGSYYYRDYYDDILMRLRVVFNGSGKLSWYLTYEYEDYGYEYYAPSLRSLPGGMPGTEKASGENITYSYDGVNDQITFNTRIKASNKDVTLQINRKADGSVASINFTESLSGDFYDCGTTKLFKI